MRQFQYIPVRQEIVHPKCPKCGSPLGQWEGVDPGQRKWFDGLMQPQSEPAMLWASRCLLGRQL